MTILADLVGPESLSEAVCLARIESRMQYRWSTQGGSVMRSFRRQIGAFSQPSVKPLREPAVIKSSCVHAWLER